MMNSTSSTSRVIGLYAVAIVGTFFLMAWLVSFVRKYTQPPPLNAARAEERAKAYAELEAANANALANYGWLDQGKGLVQLPIDVAMQLTIQEWRQPAAARAKLVRMANMIAGPPPAQGTPAASPGAQGAAPAQKGGAAPAAGLTNTPAAPNPGGPAPAPGK